MANLPKKSIRRDMIGEGRVIHWELCKKLKLDHDIKWYMYKSEFVPAIYMFKIFWDLEIQTDHQIPARRPDLVLINKRIENPPY